MEPQTNPIKRISLTFDPAKFTIRPHEQLFESSGKDYYTALSQKKCPLCSGNLYLMAHGKMWFCKSKTKHPKFIIGVGKMNKYLRGDK